MPKYKPFNIEVDTLTRSIENAVSGDSFKTEVLELTPHDIKKLKKLIGFLIGKGKQNRLTKLFTNLSLLTMLTSYRGLSACRIKATIFLCL